MNKKVLIAYFSHEGEAYAGGKIVTLEIGNTRVAAQMMEDMTGADVFRIETVNPYPYKHMETVTLAQEEQKENARPELKENEINIESYDTIILGYPTWWYTMAPAVLTFLHTESFVDKTVIPFMTNAGWPGNVIKDMKTACKGADIKYEMEIQFDSTGGSRLETPMEDITKWIQNVKQIINN